MSADPALGAAVGCAFLAAAGVLLAVPSRASLRFASGSAVPRFTPAHITPALLVAPMAGAWVWLDLRQGILLAVAVLVVLGVLQLVRRRRGAASADRRAARVLTVCDAIAAELEAGLPPGAALDRASADWGELWPVAVAARMGADVPAALRAVALRPGAAQLHRVAATWQVAHETGAGLARSLRSAADAIRAEQRTARVVATELAAANATARMLAVLPLAILLLGMGVGGDPVRFLLGTTGGAIVLALGVALGLAGILWLQRIADRVLGR